ncbi:unnamed protein product [Paramecium octaurelia]|uniref:Uncharacterized protein n=1 Tax=Paramecium octaurelia TaxID=43137 RepID=A0A8S1T3G5_PAROT|nr:unnamed protein product [Paramecium octaurelia]
MLYLPSLIFSPKTLVAPIFIIAYQYGYAYTIRYVISIVMSLILILSLENFSKDQDPSLFRDYLYIQEIRNPIIPCQVEVVLKLQPFSFILSMLMELQFIQLLMQCQAECISEATTSVIVILDLQQEWRMPS